MAVVLLLLNPYVDAILAVALAICIGGIMNSLTQYIEKIPWVGGAIANAVGGMAQAITHACGVILRPLDNAVGGTLHQLARLVDWTYSEFRSHARLLLDVAQLLTGVAIAVRLIKHSIGHLITFAHSVPQLIKTLTKEYHGIEHRVKTLEREIAGGIGNDIRIHIKALEKWEEAAKAQLKADAKAITQTLPGELTQLQNFIKAIPGTSYLEWAAGIVAAALGAGLLRNLLCKENPFNSSANRCGSWGDLSQLLGLLATVIAVEDFQALVREMQQAEKTAAEGLHDLLNL